MKFYKNNKGQFVLTNTPRLEILPTGLFIFSPSTDELSFSIKLSNGMNYTPFVDVLITTVQKENNSYYASLAELYSDVYEFFNN
jgi:hypothetical protein